VPGKIKVAEKAVKTLPRLPKGKNQLKEAWLCFGI